MIHEKYIEKHVVEKAKKSRKIEKKRTDFSRGQMFAYFARDENRRLSGSFFIFH
jgi:hypothetical protein